jgi:hypothetical protein
MPFDRTPLYQRAGTVVSLGSGRRVAEVLAGPHIDKAATTGYVEVLRAHQ